MGLFSKKISSPLYLIVSPANYYIKAVKNAMYCCSAGTLQLFFEDNMFFELSFIQPSYKWSSEYKEHGFEVSRQ